MKFSYMSSMARYVFSLIILSLCLMMAGILVIGGQGQQHPGVNVPESNLGWMVAGSLMMFILLMLVSVFFTQHEVAEREIVIRQGILFRGVIPLENVTGVAETLRKPFGLGVRIGLNRTLFVNTALSNLVAIELEEPQRFKVFFLIPLWKMRRVVINVTDPEAFIRCVHDRLKPPARHEPPEWA